MIGKAGALDRRFLQQFLPPVMGVLVLVAIASGVLEFFHARREVQEQGRNLMKLYVASLQKPLWDVDSEAVRGIVDALAAIPIVRGVKLQDDSQHLEFLAGETVNKTDAHVMTERVEYTDRQGRLYSLATLSIELRQPAAWQTTLHGLYTYFPLLGAALVAVVLTGVAVNRRLVTRPLEEFRDAIERRQLGESPAISLRELPPDELGEVMQAYIDEARQRQRTEAALLANQERLRRLTDKLPSAFLFQFRRDEKGDPLFPFITETIKDVLGVTPEDVYQNPLLLMEMIDPQERETMRVAEDLSCREFTDFSVETPITTADGRKRWAHIISRPHRLPGGDIMFAGIHMDITEIRETQEELKRSRANAQAIIEAIADPVFVFPFDYEEEEAAIFAEVNESACLFLGLSREELLRAGPALLYSNSSAVQRDIRFKLLSERRITFETVLRRKDDQVVPVEINASLVEISGRQTAIAVARSLIDRKQREQELHEAVSQAEAANHAKSRFIANMSHEIRTPMNAIIGFSEILADSLRNPDKQEKARIIASSGRSLLALVNDILDLSKIEAGRVEVRLGPMKIDRLLRETKDFFSHLASQKQLSLNVEIDPSVPAVVVLDEVRLRQILINLVANAIKFTPQGEVRVIARARTSSQPNLCELEIEVIDTGIGIPEARKELVFEMFEQGRVIDDSSAGGTGLGLAISQRLTRLLGGEISLRDNPTGGSIFTVNLPDVTVGTSSVEDVAKSKSDGTLRFHEAPLTLIVDDARVNRELLKHYLGLWGFPVIEASDGVEALQLAQLHKPRLILTDLRMPKLNGSELLHKLRSSEDPLVSNALVIAITAAAMPQQARDERRLFTAFLTKPLSPKSLVAELAKHFPHMRIGRSAEVKKSPPTRGALVVENREKLLQQIQGDLLAQLQLVQRHLRMKDAKDFARNLQETAELCGAPALGLFACEISETAKFFQVEKLTRRLEELLLIFDDLLKTKDRSG